MNQTKVKKLRKIFTKLTGLNSFKFKGLFRKFKKYINEHNVSLDKKAIDSIPDKSQLGIKEVSVGGNGGNTERW